MIELGFDPLLRVGELTLRWQTIGVTVALLCAFAVAAVTAPVAVPPRAVPRRLDDLVLIMVGIVPGAVLGGRLVHGIGFLDTYAADPLRLLDPGVGSLSLLGAVLGGLVTAGYVARLIGASIRHWADVAAVPLLIALGLGKLAQLLGGSGQGLPFDGPWAVAFTGAGPWVSANPQLPSHPAQVYEAMWLLLPVPLIALRPYARRLWWLTRRRIPQDVDSGRTFLAVLAWFLLGRVLVGFVWRDSDVLGPLNVEQILALVALVGTLTLAPRVIVGLTQRSPSPAAQEPRP